MINNSALATLLFLAILCNALSASISAAADLVIVADSRLTPVRNIISGIKTTLRAPMKVVSPAEAKGELDRIVAREGPRVVVALGREALDEALRLPSNIPVIYDLVVTPPQTVRPNTTGFYMAVPAHDYADLVRSHIRSIKKIAVMGRREQLSILADDPSQQTVTCAVGNPFELVESVQRLEGADAILILPDTGLLSAAAIEEIFLVSFRRGIPIFGISEKQVKDGALLALVVDTEEVGRQIGEYAAKTIRGKSIDRIPPSPPRKHELFLNTETARRMGIRLSEEMVRMAKRAYP